MRECRKTIVLLIAMFALAAPAVTQTNEPLAQAQLEILGNRLSIFEESGINDAFQVINIGEKSMVRTCYGGSGASCGAAQAGDSRIAGLLVLADLRGPELPQPIPLQTVPGGTFVLPGFQQEGSYYLENIRLVNEATAEAIGPCDPPVAELIVRQIVLTSATVSSLSLEELQARGIVISQENFQAFDFSVGFAFGSEIVNIDLPVLFSGAGLVEPLMAATVDLEGLSPETLALVERWQPPVIVPFSLSVPEAAWLEIKEEEEGTLNLPLFGAIVIPGTVSFLNQFFDAQLIVANGAPVDSRVSLDNLQASIRLPANNVLRLGETTPPTSPGQKAPVLGYDVNGGYLHEIEPGKQAAASWTIEGLQAGTHVLTIDIEGEIVRPGRESLPVTSTARAAVDVVDARFHLTFSHPDVVREGFAYTLFVTVANMSQATQNLITVSIPPGNLVNVEPFDEDDNFVRQIETLHPGQSQTLEFPLVSKITGEVVATAFSTTSDTAGGTIVLYTGIGDLGIPLSPATLRLPRFSERMGSPELWTDEFWKASVRFLGLAYSLAVSPAGLTPAGLPRVIRSDVETRAVDLGFAGQRTFLGDDLLNSLEVLALEQLGNRKPLAEIDALRRLSDKGLSASSELAALIRHEQERTGAGAEGLFDHFAETTSYSRPYLAALMVPSSGLPAPELELRRLTAEGWTYMAYSSDNSLALRSLPYGEIFAVSKDPGSSLMASMALVGHVEIDQMFEVFLHNITNEVTEGRLLVIVPDHETGDYRKIDFGLISMPAHSVYRVTIGANVADPNSGGFEMVHWSTNNPVTGISATKSDVPLPPFEVIGVKQDYGISSANRYGQGVSYLFNRPPDRIAAETGANYRVLSTFEGVDVHDEPVVRVSEKTGQAAFLQASERVVNVRYSSPINALIDPDSKQPLVVHEHQIDLFNLIDERSNFLTGTVPYIDIDQGPPVHLGGLIAGRVVRGTGVPAANVLVELIRRRDVPKSTGWEIVHDLVGQMTTGTDGEFYFDFVEHPHFDDNVYGGFLLRATVPEGNDPSIEPAEIEEIGSVIRQQNKLAYLNIALLGRGTITGTLVYFGDHQPVVGGVVTVASTLFQEMKTVETKADGSFSIAALPVGPLTVSGRDSDGRLVYQTVVIEQPGQIVDVQLELVREEPPGLGTVFGKVLVQGAGDVPPDPEPVAGARVAVYSEGGVALEEKITDNFGNFRFTDVPAGHVTVQAAHWEVSRTAVLTDLMLAADEEAEVVLILPEVSMRTLTGKVVVYDPANDSYPPVEGAAVFVRGPGVFAYSDVMGNYVIEGLPIQSAGASPYIIEAIDYKEDMQGSIQLNNVVDDPEDPDDLAIVRAQDIVLREMTGGIDGIVLDPFGRPARGVEVVAQTAGPRVTATTALNDGSFSFNNLPIGPMTVDWSLTAHRGDGLAPGEIGFFGGEGTKILFGGHRPFVTVRMVGSGILRVHVTNANGDGFKSQLYYKNQHFSGATKSIGIQGVYNQDETDELGYFEVEIPVGSFEVVAYNPFLGVRDVSGSIEWAGQVKDVEIVFSDSSSVTGTVVDIDGVTPVAGIEVSLSTQYLLPQTKLTDAQGNFRFDLVPEGNISVSAKGQMGSVERVGVALGKILSGGQTVDLKVQMKKQGTIRGLIFERQGDQLVPLAFSQFYVNEQSFPSRTLPGTGGWFSTGADGRYEVAHVFEGKVGVVARDSYQVDRMGRASGEITADWQIVQMPDIIISTSVGTIAVLVRDPSTGEALPDSQVRLEGGSGSELTVADSDGRTSFEALPLGNYTVVAFHAPTGRTGRVRNLHLGSPGEIIDTTVYVDQRGEVYGTLFDDEGHQLPVKNGLIELSGNTSGGFLKAISSTSSYDDTAGEFSFLGIPEGHFDLVGGMRTSNRRALAEADVTETAPRVGVNMVLEAVSDVFVRLFVKPDANGKVELDPATGLFSVRLRQSGLDFTQLQPTQGYPNHAYHFPEVLVTRGGSIEVQELGNEQRQASVNFPGFEPGDAIDGDGTLASPFEITLRPRGIVRVHVLDSTDQMVPGAEVTLCSNGGCFPGVANEDGIAGFSAVPAGNLVATAHLPHTGFGGIGYGELVYDDDIIEITVRLAAAVAAHGTVYQPLPGDVYTGDPTTFFPQAGAVVVLKDSAGTTHSYFTNEDGTYRFDVLPVGNCDIHIDTPNGDAKWDLIGHYLSDSGDANGHVNLIPDAILDGSLPRVVSIVPPPGMENVSRLAVVEITFSELLDTDVLLSNGSVGQFFRLASVDGSPDGSWSWIKNFSNQPVVRFTPTNPYENFTYYGLTITGGNSGITDLHGRQMTVAGNIGSNFKTSDTVGPEVIATLPELGRPVDPLSTIRVDFNEALFGSEENLDGDLIDDAGELFWCQDPCSHDSDWQPYPVILSFTRSNYSLNVDAITQGIDLQGDTLLRRLVVSRLKDTFENEMSSYQSEDFRIYDSNAPVIDAIPFPQGASDGQLTPGVAYTLVPALSHVDHYLVDPIDGDIDRVEYYFSDPDDADNPAQPAMAATVSPYAYEFVGVYSGDGTSPATFPVWVKAFDTSTNSSNVVHVPMVVLPNQAPSIGLVSATAIAPVAHTFYAGSTIEVQVDGLTDNDSSILTLSVELWGEGDSGPMQSPAGFELLRPASGNWADLEAPTVLFELPVTLPEGSGFFFRATVIDSQRSSAAAQSATYSVADDQNPPAIENFVARDADGGSAKSLFYIGEKFFVEFRARDLETAVQAVSATFDNVDFFEPSLSMFLVSGTDDLYRSEDITVPVDVFSTTTTVVMTLTADDFGENAGSAILVFDVAPAPDTTDPVVEWLTPWEGALWPANYNSVVSSQNGVALLLRVKASDLMEMEDEPGVFVPGTISSVQFWGPEFAGGGGIVLSANAITVVEPAATDESGNSIYEVLWFVPNLIPAGSEVPFRVRVIDTGGQDVVRQIRVQATKARMVYEGAHTSVLDDQMIPTMAQGDANGPVFLLDDTVLSLYPRPDAQPRMLDSLYMYAGGTESGDEIIVNPTILTAPEIRNYDSPEPYFPLDLEIVSTFAVGAGCIVDMDERGLMGSNEYDALILDGETRAETYAGGSHGGSGWFGAPSSWQGNLNQPSSIYGNVRAPYLPGTGGGGCGASLGGHGGGVIRLFAEGALVRVVGEISADGGEGCGGGAGGAIHIVAGRLEGGGNITANGGDGNSSVRTGGGGGGRIAIHALELGDEVDLETQLAATGGENGGAFFGGAGTIYVEMIDPYSGLSYGIGDLTLTNHSTLAAASSILPALGEVPVVSIDAVAGTLTLDVPFTHGSVIGDRLVVEDIAATQLGIFPIQSQSATSGVIVVGIDGDLSNLAGLENLRAHTRSRFASFTASGATRLLIAGDLEIGAIDEPEATLNERASLQLDAEARVQLRGEGPEISMTATPDSSVELPVGSTIDISWTVTAPLGVFETSQNWSLVEQPVIARYLDVPTSVTFTGQLIVPGAASAGEATLTVEGIDISGAVARTETSWTILPNEPPSGTLSIAAGSSNIVQAGFSTNVVVVAEDAEGLKLVTLRAVGPVVQSIQSKPISGKNLPVPFTVEVDPAADGSEPIELIAEVTDISDFVVSTNLLTITVLPDLELPEIEISVESAVVGDPYTSGDDINFVISATDDVAVSTLTVTFDDISETTNGLPVSFTWEAPIVEFQTDFILQAQAIDPSGNVGTATHTITVVPFESPLAPDVNIQCPVDFDECAPSVPVTIEFTLDDEDEIDSYWVTVNGEDAGAAVSPGNVTSFAGSMSWTPPEDAQAGDEFVIVIKAQDNVPNVGSATVTLRVAGGTILNAAQTPNLTAALHNGQDLVLAGGEFVVTESLELASLTLLNGAVLTSVDQRKLSLSVSGAVDVHCGASIDVSGRGYGPDKSYPGEEFSTGYSGGSHIGVGGLQPGYIVGSTYGSVYRPREYGGGSGNGSGGRYGGGSIRIEAQSLTVDGEILANGQEAGNSQTGAGGSIWLTVVEEISGEGRIKANGGNSTNTANRGGGGGAIAIEYGTTTGSLLGDLDENSGNVNAIGREANNTGNSGGAGTVYLYASAGLEPSTYGTLFVDNQTVPQAVTRLPSLGFGEAGTGTTDAILDTGFDEIQEYFIGHWVEIRDISGQLKGTWRIAEINVGELTLEPNDAEMINLDLTDSWQGVYRFDKMTTRGNVIFESDDPVRVTDQVIAGPVVTEWITAESLTLESGAYVTHPTGQSLHIVVDGALEIKAGASIDVSGRGYGPNKSYPGEEFSTGYSGGSHIGVGGLHPGYIVGSTYGSVYRPREYGGGSGNGSGGRYGGGSIRIEAQSLTVDGEILANGQEAGNSQTGAGGSIWLTVVEEISGEGRIKANGGNSTNTANRGGGGGAIAIEYGTTTGSLLGDLDENSGNVTAIGREANNSGNSGGAGTVYLYDHEGTNQSTYGTLFIDNKTVPQAVTKLPALGFGIPGTGSGGAALVIGADPIQPYFEGHWVEIRDSSNELKGIWRIGEIDGGTVTLVPNDTETINIEVTDSWQGVYRFDKLTVSGNAHLIFGDLDDIPGGVTVEPGSTVSYVNHEAPRVEPGGFAVWPFYSTFWIEAAPDTFDDPDGIASVVVTNTTQGGSWNVTPTAGGFAATAISGVAGDEITVTVADGHSEPLEATVSVGYLPANAGPPAVNPDLITVVEQSGGVFVLHGEPGAVIDPELPVALAVTNDNTLVDFPGVAETDGSFDVMVTGSGNHSLSLTATDGHPQAAFTSIGSAWVLPGNEAPVVDETGITTSYDSPGVYKAHVAAGAVIDDEGPILISVSYQGSSWPGSVASGGATSVDMTGSSATTGDTISIVFTDSHAADPLSTTVYKQLPINNFGPPVVDVSRIRLWPMGYGFQVVGSAGAISDPDGPVMIVLENAGFGWSSGSVQVEADGSFYSRVRGITGDGITVVAEDNHAELPMVGDLVELGVLPDVDVDTHELDIGGHVIESMRPGFSVIDGGTAAASFDPWETVVLNESYDGLSMATGVVYNLKVENMMAVEGRGLVGWDRWDDGSGGMIATPVVWEFASGPVTSVEVMGNDFFAVAEEPSGITVYRFTAPVIDGPGAVWEPDCGVVQSLTLPGTVGLRGLALAAGPVGTIAVVTDDPVGELRVLDIANPAALAEAQTYDLDGGGTAEWSHWRDGEILLGRSNGSVEVWRWSDTGIERFSSYLPQEGIASDAVRMGDHLWVVVDSATTTLIEQVDLIDPQQPLYLGAYDVGEPVNDMMRDGADILVATPTRLLDVYISRISTGLVPHLVAWGLIDEPGQVSTWLELATDWVIDSVKVDWSGGQSSVCNVQDDRCDLTVDFAVSTPPVLRAYNGVFPSSWYQLSSSVIIRDFSTTAIPEFGFGIVPASGQRCGINRGTWANRWGDWTATAAAGQSVFGYSASNASADGADGVDDIDFELSAAGPVVELFTQYDELVVVHQGSETLGGGLEYWDLSDPLNPQVDESNRIEPFGGDPVVAARLTRNTLGGDILVAADNPGRFAVIEDYSNYISVQSTEFPSIEGKILDLWENCCISNPSPGFWGEFMHVLTDAGQSGRVYLYEFSEYGTSSIYRKSIDLAPGSPAIRLQTYVDDFDGANYLLVARSNGVIEIYDNELNFVNTIALPVPVYDVLSGSAREGNAAFALGDFGVAIVRGILGTPSISFVSSNLLPPGDAIHFTDEDSVLTPDGVSWPSYSFKRGEVETNPAPWPEQPQTSAPLHSDEGKCPRHKTVHKQLDDLRRDEPSRAD